MTYNQLVKNAGLKGETASYVARKLEEKNVPMNQMNNIGAYIRGSVLGGIPISELATKLDIASKIKPTPKPKFKKSVKKTDKDH